MASRLPPWLRARGGSPRKIHEIKTLLRGEGLRTVCEEARCPNAGECFGAGTATFLILGDGCTRRCLFCAVSQKEPPPQDPDEPSRVAAAAEKLGLKYVVITSVTRDDLPDGGAFQFAASVSAVRRLLPDARVEVLVPDFGGSRDALDAVLDAGPDVLAHNIETVKEMYPVVRPQAEYRRSLELLSRAAERKTAGNGHAAVKSGLMVGLGETREQLASCLSDLRASGVQLLAIGQYLRPRRANIPVRRYYEPAEFDALAGEARSMGFMGVTAGPLVRSSYHAAAQYVK
jgi:lipoic acid synthetase